LKSPSDLGGIDLLKLALTCRISANKKERSGLHQAMVMKAIPILTYFVKSIPDKSFFSMKKSVHI
jgi:hypothetical protein